MDRLRFYALIYRSLVDQTAAKEADALEAHVPKQTEIAGTTRWQVRGRTA